MEVVYHAAASVDGFIATEAGGVEWLDPFPGEGADHGFVEFERSIDVLLMGSRTYEFALSVPEWPSPRTPSRVFTSRELPIAHPSVTLTAEDPATVVAALDREGFRRAWLMGGGRLAGSFAAADLITSVVVSVIPVLLGAGIPLFAGPAGHRSLRLADVRKFSDGVVQLSYERTGGREGLA